MMLDSCAMEYVSVGNIVCYAVRISHLHYNHHLLPELLQPKLAASHVNTQCLRYNHHFLLNVQGKEIHRGVQKICDILLIRD